MLWEEHCREITVVGGPSPLCGGYSLVIIIIIMIIIIKQRLPPTLHARVGLAQAHPNYIPWCPNFLPTFTRPFLPQGKGLGTRLLNTRVVKLPIPLQRCINRGIATGAVFLVLDVRTRVPVHDLARRCPISYAIGARKTSVGEDYERTK